MSKRELRHITGASEAEGSRPKRRRETAGASSDVDVIHSEPIFLEVQVKKEGDSTDEVVVKEQGLKLWQTVKDAVNKEGRNISVDFLKKPSKRQYADYYQFIQKPIALDDIKKQLDHGGYGSLEAVKQDLELCFNNAKQYNMKDSDIWKDAKDLLKIVHKTYNKLVLLDDECENGDVDGEKKGKSKAPNLNRLIKSRLQKLVARTDSDGRVISTEFMELPSKKDWPWYYKEIKHPQCLENIFKRIKRKEYHNSSEFAADVELVFSNAMAFNQEHTPIWEDARSLRDHFRILMSDLPPPYTLQEYVKPSNGKIKIKMPPAVQLSTPVAAIPVTHPTADTRSSTSSLLLRVPASNIAREAKDAKVSPGASPTPIVSPIPSMPAEASAPPVSLPTPPTQPSLPTVSGQPLVNAVFAHYPNASYAPPDSTPTVPIASSSSNPPTEAVQVLSKSKSKSPSASLSYLKYQLKTVVFTTRPNGRTISLDYRDGVKSWATRLVEGETGLSVGQIYFLRDEDEESSGEEEELELEAKQEEGEEGKHLENDVPPKNGKKKGKGRGR
ncbi:Bromodomain-containing protein, partial [Collybia nuda]